MLDSLLHAAMTARQQAYAPYSGYKVGAAILDSEGNVWTGCNVENVSFGLCVCAERSAVCRMACEGKREIMAVAIATRDGGLPCGMCLQTLLEFAKQPSAVKVATIDESGHTRNFSLSELIPFGFHTDELDRT